MKRRWDAGFSLLEILIASFVIGVLITVGAISYSGIQQKAAERGVQSDLQQVAAFMQQAAIRDGAYPEDMPTAVKPSENVLLTIEESGTSNYYTGLTDVQNGTLFAEICQELIDEGVGKGINRGGVTEDYLTGCGNWNFDSMQITGWDTEKYDTPVQKSTIVDYGTSFVERDQWNKEAHETAVKTFYAEIVERFEARGGHFPIVSFWDYWATPTNGGVQPQPLPTPSSTSSYYCVEARHTTYSELIWHVKEDQQITSGPC